MIFAHTVKHIVTKSEATVQMFSILAFFFFGLSKKLKQNILFKIGRILENMCTESNSKFAAMQPASLIETSPFQGAPFVEVEGTNQWKVTL